MRKLITFLVILNLFSNSVWGQLPDSIIVQIGDKQINRTFFEEYYQRHKNWQPNHCKLLKEQIIDTLLLLEARRKKMKVDEVKKQKQISFAIVICYPDSLWPKEVKEKYQLTRKIVEEEIGRRVLIRDYYDKLFNQASITRREVNQYFQRQVAKYNDSLPIFQPMVELQRIVLLSQPSDSTKKAFQNTVIEKVDSIMADLSPHNYGIRYYKSIWQELSVEDFSKISNIPQSFLTKLPIGQKEVFEINQSQFLVFRIKEKSPQKTIIEFFHQNYPLEKDDKSLQQLHTIKNLIENKKLSFSRAFRQYSTKNVDKVNKKGLLLVNNDSFIELDQLDSYIYFAIDTMQVGQISQPIIFREEEGKEGYQLIYFKSKIPSEKMNIRNVAHYPKIKTSALNEKQKQIMEKWFDKMCQKYQVKVSKEYLDCLSNN